MLPDKIKQAREWAGLSMRRLSSLATLSQSHARLIEGGKRVSLQTVTQIAEVLGLSLDWLAGREGAPEPDPAEVIAAVKRAEERERERKAKRRPRKKPEKPRAKPLPRKVFQSSGPAADQRTSTPPAGDGPLPGRGAASSGEDGAGTRSTPRGASRRAPRPAASPPPPAPPRHAPPAPPAPPPPDVTPAKRRRSRSTASPQAGAGAS